MEYFIYKIEVGDKFYIGSSKYFSRRWDAHINTCTNENNKDYNLDVYIYMRNVGVSNCMFSIVNRITGTKTDARRLEQEEIDKIPKELLLNMVPAYCSEDDRKLYRHEYMKNYPKQYWDDYYKRPDIIEKLRLYNQRPEVKEKRRVYALTYVESDEVKERRRIKRQDPAVKEKRNRLRRERNKNKE